MIASGKQEDIPQLKRLWSLVFEDTEEEINAFFQCRFPSCVCLTDREEGEILSAIYLLPAKLRFGGKVRPVWYLYAAATHPKARGQGRMGSLLRLAREWARMRGIFAIALVPSEAGLFAFYRKFGYQPFFSVREILFSAQEWEEIANTGRSFDKLHVDSKQIARVRAEILQKHDGILWDDDAVEFAIRFHRIGGGEIAAVFSEEEKGYALVSYEGDEAILSECLASPGSFPEIARKVRRPEILRYRVRLPVESKLFPGRGEILPFGMLQPSGNETLPTDTIAYLGLEMG